MRKIFISYSSHDYEANMFAQFLNEHLSSIGAEPVIFEDTLKAGENWQIGVTDQINKCSIFISFVDRDNSNVMFELGYALARNKKIIIVGDCDNMPFDLRNMPYIRRESNPYDVLTRIEKYLSCDVNVMPFNAIDIHRPQEAIVQMLERPELLDTIGASEFEQLIAHWFESKGKRVSTSMGHSDYGYDLRIEPFRDDRAVVEIKKFKNTSQVPLNVIRQLLGSMMPERIHYGIVVSSAPFAKSAPFFLQDIEPTILLWTLADLAEMDKRPNERVDTYASHVNYAV